MTASKRPGFGRSLTFPGRYACFRLCCRLALCVGLAVMLALMPVAPWRSGLAVSSAQADPLVRGVQGALAGAVIGSMINGRRGAVKGAAVGVALGVIAGSMERNRYRRYRARRYRARRYRARRYRARRYRARRYRARRIQARRKQARRKQHYRAQRRYASQKRSAAKKVVKPTFNRTLVYSTQNALVSLGYDPGPIDGKYGRKTSEAIRAYQQANQLTPTGQPSEALLQKMEKTGG